MDWGDDFPMEDDMREKGKKRKNAPPTVKKGMAYLQKAMENKMKTSKPKEKVVLVSGKQNGVWRMLPVSCGVCDRRFATTGSLKQHIVTMRHYMTGKTFRCVRCGDCFLSSRSRKQHLKNHPAFKGEEEKEREEKDVETESEPVKTKGMKRMESQGLGGSNQGSSSGVGSAASASFEDYAVKLSEMTQQMIKEINAKARHEKEIQEQQEAEKSNVYSVLEQKVKIEYWELMERKKAIEADQDMREREVVLKEKTLEEEIQRMKKMNDIHLQQVELNVGGTRFLTTVSTLSKFSDSMLGTMFSGRHSVQQNKDGAVFIDRSPQYFNYILNFLRDGEVFIPKSEEQMHGLMMEANFYGLKDLVEAVKAQRYAKS